MTKLGEFFPEENQSDYIGKVIKIRSVIKLYELSTTPPKEKRFVIIGESVNEFALLFINSNLNENVHKPGSVTHSLQIAINKYDGCNYLRHNSYVDCTRIIPKDKIKVISTITNNQDLYLGKMDHTHWDAVYTAVVGAPTISPKQKKMFKLV